MPLITDVVNREHQRNGHAKRGRVSRRMKDVQPFMADGARKIDQRPAEVRRKGLPDGHALRRARLPRIDRCAKDDDRVTRADPDELVEELARVPPHATCR